MKFAEDHPVATRIATVATLLKAGQSAVELGGKARTAFYNGRARFMYDVRVRDSDPLYREIHDRLLDQVPSRRLRSIAAASQPAGDTASRVWFTGEQPHTMTIDGHTVRVYFRFVEESSADLPSNPLVANSDGTISFRSEISTLSSGLAKPRAIRILASSAAGRDAVLGWVEQVAEEYRKSDRPPLFRIVTRWGSWQDRSTLAARPLDSIILPEGQLDGILKDLNDFLSQEADYIRKGIPWHRGYLFEGPPGTGKTSIGRAIASHYKRDLHYIPLGDVDMDTNLLGLVSDIQRSGVLLLEDIDVFQQARDRARSEGKEVPGHASLSGLLNALDGVATPHGLITIVTTNAQGSLDSALIRPGRIDRTEHFGYVTADQANRIFEWFYSRPPQVPFLEPQKISPAEILEILKRRMGHPTAGEHALHAYISKRKMEDVDE